MMTTQVTPKIAVNRYSMRLFLAIVLISVFFIDARHFAYGETGNSLNCSNVLVRIVDTIPSNSLVFVTDSLIYNDLIQLIEDHNKAPIIKAWNLGSDNYRKEIEDKYKISIRLENPETQWTEIMHYIMRKTEFSSYVLLEGLIVPWTYKHLKPHLLVNDMKLAPRVTRDDVNATEREWTKLLPSIQFEDGCNDNAIKTVLAKLRATGGSVYAANGYFHEAKIAYKDSLALAPMNRDIILRYLELIVQKGDYAEAKNILTNQLAAVDADTATYLLENLRQRQERERDAHRENAKGATAKD